MLVDSNVGDWFESLFTLQKVCNVCVKGTPERLKDTSLSRSALADKPLFPADWT